jgi:hypothetical protein
MKPIEVNKQGIKFSPVTLTFQVTAHEIEVTIEELLTINEKITRKSVWENLKDYLNSCGMVERSAIDRQAMLDNEIKIQQKAQKLSRRLFPEFY